MLKARYCKSNQNTLQLFCKIIKDILRIVAIIIISTLYNMYFYFSCTINCEKSNPQI